MRILSARIFSKSFGGKIWVVWKAVGIEQNKIKRHNQGQYKIYMDLTKNKLWQYLLDNLWIKWLYLENVTGGSLMKKPLVFWTIIG